MCSNSASCYYLFSVYFNGTNGPMKSSLLITHQTNLSQTVQLSQTYVDIIQMGTYQYYKFVPTTTDGYNFLESLVINLYSYVGDADLFVSNTTNQPTMSNFKWESRKMQTFD